MQNNDEVPGSSADGPQHQERNTPKICIAVLELSTMGNILALGFPVFD